MLEPTPASPQPTRTNPLPTTRTPLLTTLVVGTLILLGGSLLYWQNSRLNPPEVMVDLSNQPLESVTVDSGIGSSSTEPSETLSYVLPTGWTEAEAEGNLTPYYSFLKRLRSTNGCNQLVIARFLSDDLSLDDFLISQYPDESLAQLRHPNQFSIAGLETFTIKPQADTESFNVYLKGNRHVFGLFASHSTDSSNPTCQANPPELAPLLNSVKLQ